MNGWRAVYHLMRADFFERTRRYSFLITLGMTAYAGYTFVPAPTARYVTIGLGTHRGIYNSAWIGSMVAMMTVTFLALAGFYLVKNAIDRDRVTRVGQILAATRITRPLYTLGKMLSNFAVLSLIVGVLLIIAVMMQLLRGEESRIELWPLIAPFLIIALPAMLFVAALAVLFETIGWLRGAFGNVVYFFLWTAVITAGMSLVAPWGSLTAGWLRDPLGASIPMGSMINACKARFPDYDGNFDIGYSLLQGAQRFTTFRWDGVAWSAAILLSRLFWVGAAFGIAMIAARFFDRFDPARTTRGAVGPSRREVAEERSERGASTSVHLPPLGPSPMRFAFPRMLAAELRLMLKGLRWWWLAVSIGLVIGCLAAPLAVARQWVLPFAWLWPLPIFSAMGTREARNDTGQLLFSAPHPLSRLLPASWTAGVIVAAAAGSGVGIRSALAGQWTELAAWFTGALFIPTLAVALGVCSGSPKLFEVVYTVLWYIGPVNQMPALDFMGATNAAHSLDVPMRYFIVTLVLLLIALVGRRRQMTSLAG